MMLLEGARPEPPRRALQAMKSKLAGVANVRACRLIKGHTDIVDNDCSATSTQVAQTSLIDDLSES
jgi:hypothetical protein